MANYIMGRLRYPSLLLVVSLLGCRTAKPTGEILDPATVQSVVADPNEIPLDSDGGGGVSALWSPAQRRANATYQFILAQRLLMQGDFTRSLPLLESSYNLDPNAYSGSQLVRVRLAANDVDEAMVEAHRMTLLYPKDDKLRLLYGLVLSSKGDFKGAEIQFRKCIELNSKNEEAQITLAKILLAQKKIPEASAVLQKLNKEVQSSAQGWSLLTKIYIVGKKYREALPAAKQAYMLQPSHPENAFLYGLTLDLNGRPKEAVALYEQLLRANATDPELVERMVSLYRDLGNLDDALSLIDDLLARAKVKHPGLVFQRALILWELNRNEEAAKDIEGVLQQNPESDKTLFMAGFAQERLKNPENASDRYQKIPEESPLFLQAGYRRALILREKKDIDGAVKLMNELTNRPDADIGTWQIMIEILADAKRFDDARDAATKGAAAFPDKIQMLFLRGVYEERTGRNGDAERTMRAIIKQDPSHSSALNFLGYMLAEQGRELEEAESLVERALKIKPNDGSYLDSLGWILYQRKDFKKALEILTKALGGSPDEGVIMEHIGDVYVALGDKMTAAQYYDRSLKTNLDERDKTRIERKFKELTAALQ